MLLASGDLLVFNDTRVIPARVCGGQADRRAHRAAARAGPARARALVQLRDSKAVARRHALQTCRAAQTARMARRDGDLFWLEFSAERAGVLRGARRRAAAAVHRASRPTRCDRERYQSIWARAPGAVAAPTASLHFDAALLAALDAARRAPRHGHAARRGRHVPAAARPSDIERTSCTPSAYVVPRETWRRSRRTRAAGGRVVAVGTTVVRCARVRGPEPAGSSLRAVQRRDHAVHPARLSLPRHRRAADEFPSAAVDAADAGARPSPAAKRCCRLRARGARALPFFQLR